MITSNCSDGSRVWAVVLASSDGQPHFVEAEGLSPSEAIRLSQAPRTDGLVATVVDLSFAEMVKNLEAWDIEQRLLERSGASVVRLLLEAGLDAAETHKRLVCGCLASWRSEYLPESEAPPAIPGDFLRGCGLDPWAELEFEGLPEGEIAAVLNEAKAQARLLLVA